MEKLKVHVPEQAGIENPRRVLTVCFPPLRDTSTTLDGGKAVSGESSLITIPMKGRMTLARGVRSGSAKPEAKVERTETAAMRVSFMVGRG